MYKIGQNRTTMLGTYYIQDDAAIKKIKSEDTTNTQVHGKISTILAHIFQGTQTLGNYYRMQLSGKWYFVQDHGTDEYLMMNLCFFPANHSNSCGAFATAATFQIMLCLPEHRPRFRQLEADGLLQLPFPLVGQLQLIGGGPQGGLRAAQLRQCRVIFTSEPLQVSLQHMKLEVIRYRTSKGTTYGIT